MFDMLLFRAFHKLMKRKIHKAPILTLLVSFFFLVTGVKGQEALTKLKVITEMSNIRLKPSIGSIIIHQVPQGTILESPGKEGEWFAVKITTDEGDEVSGFIHESTVIVTERPPEPKPKPKKEEMLEEKVKGKIEEAKVPVKTQEPVKTEEPQKAEEEKVEEKPQVELVPVRPEIPKPFESLIEVTFLGGGSYVLGGDLNSGAKGFADYYRNFLSVQGRGKVSSLHLSTIVGGELAFSIGSNLSLGLGLDYLSGENESLVELQETPARKVLTRPKIQAFPLKLYLFYQPIRYFYVKAGIEYYFAKCEYIYRYSDGDFWKEWHGKASAQGPGAMAAVGLDLDILPYLSFIVELTGHTAKISGFKGTDHSTDSNGLDYTEEGKLYFYQGITPDKNSFPLLFIKEKKPSEDVEIANPREAIIKFSGISLKTGFKFRF